MHRRMHFGRKRGGRDMITHASTHTPGTVLDDPISLKTQPPKPSQPNSVNAFIENNTLIWRSHNNMTGVAQTTHFSIASCTFFGCLPAGNWMHVRPWSVCTWWWDDGTNTHDDGATHSSSSLALAIGCVTAIMCDFHFWMPDRTQIVGPNHLPKRVRVAWLLWFYLLFHRLTHIFMRCATATVEQVFFHARERNDRRHHDHDGDRDCGYCLLLQGILRVFAMSRHYIAWAKKMYIRVCGQRMPEIVHLFKEKTQHERAVSVSRVYKYINYIGVRTLYNG